MNPFWSDEIIYHETRRIVIAILQHIVYKQFIPLVIGTSRSNFGTYQYDPMVQRFLLIFRMNIRDNMFIIPQVGQCDKEMVGSGEFRRFHGSSILT